MTPMFTHCAARAFTFLPGGLEGTFAKRDPNLLINDPPPGLALPGKLNSVQESRAFMRGQAGQGRGTGWSFLVLTTDSAPSRMSSTRERHSPPISRCQTTRQ